ncbi:MAG TPA: FAD-dependent monooxygenase, partial [Pseudomonadales bacterium]|nr:FAD-dependent monooxygenase [Pseudomonadales bacterium]
MKQFDVVIIGGGLVGATLALCLSKLKSPSQNALKIAVIEAFPMNTQAEGSARYTPSYDARTSAIANGTVELFESLGVWQPMREHACPIEHIHVSEVGGFGVTRIHAEEEKIPAMGYVVENHWMGAVLNAALANANTAGEIHYYAPANVIAWRYLENNAGMELSVQTKDQTLMLTANLVVAADGATSSVREMLGVASDTHDYGQSAIVTNFTTDKAHQHWAYERFTKNGPIALLPLVQERIGCVWALPPEQAAHYAQCDEAEFKAGLLQQIGDRIGTITRVGQRFLYPLKLTVA